MRAFLIILPSVVHSVKRSSVVWLVAILAVGAASVRAVDLAWRRMENSQTGRAKWIWATDDVKVERPARFVARRSIVIEEAVTYARVKIFVDRKYRVFLDGRVVGAGGMAPGDPLDEYDVSDRFPRGIHTFSIEAESPTGIGGILFALDISGHGRNAVVSDATWAVDGRPAFVWGEPPMYPWGFPAVGRAR
jgi:hypothetical protein